MAIRVDVPQERGDEKVEDIYLGDDGPFTFWPPKSGGLMDVALFDGTPQEQEMLAIRRRAEWIRDGFDPDDWAHIDARLKDADDPLDWDHLIALQEQVQEAMALRPPTSSRGSSTSRRRTNTGAARPKRQESTSGDSESGDSAT